MSGGQVAVAVAVFVGAVGIGAAGGVVLRGPVLAARPDAPCEVDPDLARRIAELEAALGRDGTPAR